MTVNWATTGGTATSDTDFTAASDTLTFMPGEMEKTVTVETTEDTTDEDDETFTLTLSSPSNVTLAADPTATGTIKDNDDPPMLSVAGGSAADGDGDGRRRPRRTTATWTALETTATFTVATGMVTVTKGQTTVTFTVATAQDTTDEENETFTVTLSTPSSNATLAADPTATGTITDNALVFSETAPRRAVPENSAAGVDVGAPVTATPADTLEYTLEGRDASSFDIVSTSGQIRTKSGVTYDYEEQSSYAVTVKASDGTASATIAVRINLRDVAEQSDTPAKPTLAAVSGSTTRLVASWTEPGLNEGPAINGYEVEYREGMSGTWTFGVRTTGTTTTTTIDGLTASTSYQVRVRALNGETPSDWSDPSDAVRTNTETTLSSDATLSSLELSGITLNPAFSSSEITYTASVANTVSSTTVMAATTDDGASVAIALNGAVSDGTVNLEVGDNTITVAVTAENGTPMQTYTVTVTRNMVDTEDPKVTLHLSDADGEVAEDASAVTVTATVSPASPSAFTVTISASPVAPATDADFTLSTNLVLRFAANATASAGTVTIAPVDDGDAEPTQVVTVSGSASIEGVTGPDDVILTILDDDPVGMDGICDRTPRVRDRILTLLKYRHSFKDGCGEVNETHLAKLKSLDLGRNPSTESAFTLILQSDDFEALVNLKRLDLRETGLSSLPAGVFSGLAALDTLGLGKNQLDSLPAGVFSGLKSLQTLDLSKNPLSLPPFDEFEALPKLTKLWLDSVGRHKLQVAGGEGDAALDVAAGAA